MCGCNSKSSCNCNNGAIPEFTSQLSYDGTIFQCEGIPEFIVRPCDDLNQVLNLMMNYICQLSQNQLFQNTNIGGGAEVFAQQNGIFQEFRTLIPDFGITITENPSDITFGLNFTSTGGSIGITQNGNALNLEVLTGSGENNTASNVGAGIGLFKQKIGVDLQFKSLLAGDGVNIIDGVDEVTIEAPCGCTQFFNDQAIDLTLPGTTIVQAVNIGATWTVPVGGAGDYLAIFNLLISQTNSPARASFFVAVNGTPVTTEKSVELTDVGEVDTAFNTPGMFMYNGTLNDGDVVSIMGYAVTGTNVITNQQGVVVRSGL